MSDLESVLLRGSRVPGPDSKSHLPVAVGEDFDPVLSLPTPALTLDQDAVLGNVRSMAAWTAERGVELVPHGKTTMAPALWAVQLAAGASGITVATPAQARVAAGAGVPFVVIANEVIDPVGLASLARMIDDGVEVLCWVDSVAAVAAMSAVLAREAPRRPLSVCIELGALGARTGVRDDGLLAELVAAVETAPHLRLAGFAGYEGSVPGEGADRLSAIRAFLHRIGAAAERFADRIDGRPIVSAGGSAWFDLVVDGLAPVVSGIPGARLLLRSGAYVLHDDLHYSHETPSATRSGPAFTAAATLWARVLSVPEEGLALLDAGKRDLAYDVRLPVPRAGRRADGRRFDVADATVVGSNDQHAYLRTGRADIRVGDLLELGQAHPCTIVDKWRDLPVVRRGDGDRLHLSGFIATDF